MQISSNGLQQIIQREGVILHAYQDSVGVWTIGTGHTSAAGPPTVSPGQVITKEQNDEILSTDLKPIEQQFTQYVSVPVTQNQYDAIISIVFNVGPKFWHSTCIQRLNAGDIQGASQAIMLWNIPREIIGRRKTEQVQFNTPDSSSITSPSIDDINNKVSSFTSLITTIKSFLSENIGSLGRHVSVSAVTAAGSISALWTQYWPYVLGGALIMSVLIWAGLKVYQRRQD